MLLKLEENKLTDKLIGFAFEIYNNIGPGYPEKIYQNAFELKLKDNNLKYYRENYCKIEFEGRIVGSFKLDFLVENKVIVEFKVREQLYNQDTAQLLTYLKLNKIKIGLIFLYTNHEVKIKRLLV